jgi:hypothetical protein
MALLDTQYDVEVVKSMPSLQTPYKFSEDSDFKRVMLVVINHIRGLFEDKGDMSIVVSSRTIQYKIEIGQIQVEEILKNMAPRKLRLLISLSMTFLGGQWETKHNRRNALMNKETMETQIKEIFGRSIPWKTTQKK